MKSRKKSILFCILFLALLANACEKVGTNTAPEERAYNVQVRAAGKKALRPFVEAIGTLHPHDEVTVSTEVDGILRDLKVDEGTRVSKDMLLAVIDDTDYNLEVKRAEGVLEAVKSRLQQLLTGARPQEIQLAKAEVDQTLADREKRKADMERAKKLVQDKYISAQEWDSARTAYDVAVATHQKTKENYALVVEGPRKEEIAQARAQVDQSQAALSLARQKLSKTKIFSPLVGTVRVRKVSKGEFVKNGAALFVIIQSNPIKLRFTVTERDVGKVKMGQEVSLRVDAFPTSEFKGGVTTIYPSLEEKTRTLLVEALIPNADERLKPGFFAKVVLYTGQPKETVVIPVTALLYEESKIRIFVEEQSRAKEKVVKVGGKYGEWMEIMEGLQEGEKVVVAGQQNLSEGVKVNVAR
jgi:multidrug efflux pump subunit AcrA (membrane-fusion protein)